MSRLTIFWLAILVASIAFFASSWLNVSIWLQGQIDGRASPGVRVAIGAGWRWLRRVGLWRALHALLLDGLFHQRLLREDFGRWLAHACLLGGFSVMFALSLLTGFCEEILILIFKVHHPLVEAIVNKDTPIIALANESLGLIMLVGMAMVILRRYVRRPAQLRTAAPDTVLVVLLALTLVSGYPTEVLRLLKDQVPPHLGWYSFIGYPLSLPLRALNWPWERLHYWTFLFHSLLATACFAYIPFSKFFHVLVSPVVATVNSVAQEGAKA